MQFAKKKGHIRHRLLAGLFCISLLAADLASAMPVWAKEPVAEEQTQGFNEGGSEETQDSDSENKEETAEKPGEDNGVDKVTNPDGEGGENQTQNPDGEKEGEGEASPDDEKGGDSAQNPGGGEDGDGAQNPGDGTNGNDAQNPDEGKDGDDAQNPDGGEDGDNTQNPDEGDTETDDPEEEPGAPEEDEAPEEEERDSVSDNSVSENDMEVMGEVRALAVPAGAIASGSYGNITWVIDAAGKLTVEGTGNYGESRRENNITPKAPWLKYADSIVSAEIAVSGITDVYRMFYLCKNLQSVDLSKSDMSSVVYMDFMFDNCSKLTEINLGDFKTGNAVTMENMFGLNSPIESLDLSSFDTSKVKNMSFMFRSCYKLADLDISSFDTSQVTTMRGMFSGCHKLKSLDVTNFNTSNVTDMSAMFNSAELTSLDVSGFNTGNVTNMEGMFSSCSGLTSLDLSHFDTAQVTDMAGMFSSCSGLTSLDLSHFDTAQVTNMGGMFSGCRSLTSLDLSHFDTSAVTEMGNMFGFCESLSDLDLRSFDTGRVLDMGAMFEGCTNLSRLDVGGFDTSTCTSMFNMFAGCKSLQTLDLSSFNCGKVTSIAFMLYLGKGKPYVADRIYTPKHLAVKCELPGNRNGTITDKWYDVNGKEYTELPQSLDYSIMLYKNKKPEAEAARITVRKSKTAYTCGETIALDDLTVTYYGSDGSVKKLEQSAYTTNVGELNQTMTEPGEKKLVVTCQGGGMTLTAEIILTVTYGLFADNTEIVLPTAAYTYDGTPKTPEPAAVTYTKPSTNGTGTPVTLTEGTDYTVSYRNNTDACEQPDTDSAAPTIIIKGTGSYSGTPVSYSGKAVVKAEDGTDITEKVALVYHYSGTMADGTAYPAQGGAPDGSDAEKPPADAGSYRLTISVKDDDPDYAGSEEYPFTIAKADAVVRANDMIVLMQAGGGTVSVGENGVGEYAFGYETAGLLNGDRLTTGPSYIVTTDEEGKDTVTSIDISKTGEYYIHPSKADAGMNYSLTYKPGILTVSEERVAYTVTFDGMGYCDGFRKSGIKSGALLELSDSERMPAAKEQGHVFAGWYRDRTFAKGKEWNFDTETVQSDLTLYACWLSAAAEDGNGLKLCVQEIPDQFYTGSAQKPAVTVYDSDGKTLLKSGKDYTVKYVNNTNAVAVGGDGKPAVSGGTASVINAGKANEKITDMSGHFSKECPYVVITGKGNYAETIYRNFLILPAQIPADGIWAGQQGDTPLSAGFTLKYTDQLVADGKKEQKPFGSIKYKKAMKAGTDFTVSLGAQEVRDGAGNAVPDWKAEGTLNARKQYTLPAIPKGYSGAFTLTVTGKGNYAGTVRRKVYVSEKQKLMKNATITLGKNQKTFAYTGQDVMLTPGYYDAATKKNYKVTAAGTVSGTAEENANDMFLVKAGKNGKAGGEGLVWGRDYTIDYAGTNRAAGTATMTLTGINGYVGTKSVTFKITGAKFAANTVDVKAYDSAKPGDPQTDAFRASMPYTGKAVTQNKVMLTTKVTKSNPTVKEFNYGEHYTISYKNNVKKGTATMTFTAKPASGYTGSFKKTFRITAQELSKDRLTVAAPGGSGDSSAAVQTGSDGAEAVYSKNGAKLSFAVTNEAGAVLREGTDYTVKYKNNNAVTTAQTAENKRPLMTVTGKGNYAGKVEVSFAVIPASLKTVIADQTVSVSCAQVQRKNGMKCKDFKFKLVEGKKTLSMGEAKDYVIDETKCTPEIIQAYADALAASDASTGAASAGTPLPPEPVVKVTGKGGYAGRQTADPSVEIPLGKYIYADKLVTANLYVVVFEGSGQNIYTGGQVKPDVAVYYGEKTAVAAAKKDKVKDEATAQKYKLTKLAADTDYTLSYGANTASGKNKGSVTVTGAGKYGGSVTVRFTIEKKSIY